LNKKLHPSSDPVVENAQHEPHCPWFLTGVTAPAVTQSTDAGKALTSSSVGATPVNSTSLASFKQLI